MELSDELLKELKRFLDDEGRLTLFPAKRRYKILSLLYLSTKFDHGVIYKEKQVNELIENFHTFQDKWLLRRELINTGFLERLTDGSKYWKREIQPTLKDFDLE